MTLSSFRVMFLVALVTWVLVTWVAGSRCALCQESEAPGVISGRNLRTVIGESRWANIADGYRLNVHSDQQKRELLEVIKERTARVAEYEATKRLTELRDKLRLPADMKRVVAFANTLMSRYDQDKDGVLTGDEIPNLRQFADADDNADGKFTFEEVMRFYGARLNPRSVVPKDWQENSEHYEMIEAKLRELEQASSVDRRRHLDDAKLGPFYEIVEVGRDFIRLRDGDTERILALAAIREVTRRVK